MGLACSLWACQPKNEAHVAGTLTNPKGDKVYVQIHGLEKPVVLPLDSTGHFEGVIPAKEAYYGRICNGKAKLPAYINGGVDLKVAMDVKEVAQGEYKNVKVEGEKVKETRMMVKYFQNQLFPSTEELFVLSPIEFKMKIQSVIAHNAKLVDDFTKANEGMDEHFVDLFKIQIQLPFAVSFLYYPMYHSMFVPNDQSKVPENFNFFVNQLPRNDIEIYNKVPRYKSYEVSIWNNEILAAIAPFQPDLEKYFNAYVDEVKKLEINSQIKEDVANNLLASNYKPAPDNIKEIFRTRYKEILTDPNYIANFEKMIGIGEKK